LISNEFPSQGKERHLSNDRMAGDVVDFPSNKIRPRDLDNLDTKKQQNPGSVVPIKPADK
jgi:hypothetical protein